jgi:hypothetical protein
MPASSARCATAGRGLAADLLLERLRPPARVLAALRHEQGGGDVRGLELLGLVPIAGIDV